MRDAIISTLLSLVGFALICWGLGMVFPPAAVIVAGICLVAAGFNY